jgi:hypothetical protein
MIRVSPQPEPNSFSEKVRNPGQLYLREVPFPKSWDNREYWRKMLPELYNAYAGICAYSAEWIPLTTGDPTVDHYVPKSTAPQLVTWGLSLATN